MFAEVKTDLTEAHASAPPVWTSHTMAGDVGSQWLDDFSDPVLHELVAEAIAVNHDLHAAAARVDASRARAVIAGADQLPRVDAGLGGARRGAPAGNARRTTENSFEVNTDATWEVDVWERLANSTRAAAYEADAVAADMRAARLSLAANVARGWFSSVELELQVRLAEETVANFRDNLEVVEEGFRRGLNSALDVHLERANLASARARLAVQQIDRDQTIRALEVLLGRYPGAELAITSELARLNTPVPSGLPADILVRRPDIQAALLRVAASDERTSAALKNRLPSIVLTASAGLSSGELSRLLDFDALLWRIAGDLATPLLHGGALDAERDLAHADSSEALAIYTQSVLNAFQEVETALTAEQLLIDQEAALEVAARESEAAAELALERYRRGLVDIITWLEARRGAVDARSALLTVANQRLQNRVALYLALGGDFGAELPKQALQSGYSGNLTNTADPPATSQ